MVGVRLRLASVILQVAPPPRKAATIVDCNGLGSKADELRFRAKPLFGFIDGQTLIVDKRELLYLYASAVSEFRELRKHPKIRWAGHLNWPPKWEGPHGG